MTRHSPVPAKPRRKRSYQFSPRTSLIAIVAFSITANLSMLSSAAEPANPQANNKARAILKYIDSLPQRSDKRLISGQFCGAGPQARIGACRETFTKTGHWPAIIGLDYADFARGSLSTYTVDHLAIDYARDGGLVTISAHMPNPANANGGGLRDKGVKIADLLDPKSVTHDRWRRELDTIAAGLAELQEADVVVLWRPFHEMNGNWFWWGGQEPAASIPVWRDMFDYFTKTKKLNNLLWVYSPNHGEKTAAYYPGDKFVDLVGLDAYTDFVDPEHIKGYAEIARLPKPFGFAEFGPHGPENPPGDFDYRKFLAGVKQHFPKAAFFQSWNGRWGLGSNENTKQLLDDPWIVNRENLPREFAARPH